MLKKEKKGKKDNKEEKEERKMKIVLFDRNSFLDSNTPFKLEGRSIGVIRGLIVINQKERDLLIEVAQKIWRYLIRINPSFIGHIRFDFVPEFSSPFPKESSWRDMKAIELGQLKIKGFYEVNAHSPECSAALSALHRAVPDFARYQPKASFILAKAIRKTFGDRKIAFVQGQGQVKKSWGRFFFEDLQKAGLNLVFVEPEQRVSLSSSPIIWRWGDVRPRTNFSEYPQDFQQWLYSYKGVVFNTIPIKQDLSDKSLLIDCFNDGQRMIGELFGKNRFLNKEEDLNWGIKNQKNLVCKPLKGSSGNGITFGRKEKRGDWEKILRDNLARGGYGLYEARWLPKIVISSYGEFTLDINPAFWAEGSSLRYLYTVVRIDSWKRYWERGVINVSQGGGFAGTLIEE